MAIAILALFQVIFAYLSTKILSRNYIFSFKEFLYIVISGGSIGLLYQYLNIFTNLLVFFTILLLWKKKLSTYEAFIVSSLGMSISILSDHTASFLRYVLFNNAVPSTEDLFVLHMPLYYLVGILFSLVGSFILKHVLSNLYRQDKSPAFLAVFSTCIWLTYLFSIIILRYSGNQAQLILMNLVFLMVYIFLFFGTLFIYVSATRKQYETLKKEADYVNMERYTHEMEQHYSELRKFRHDYQNILTSLESYIAQEDMEGLKAFFYSNIKEHSSKILKDEYRLKDLSHVKIKAVKSIIAAKLIYAQDRGLNASLEAPEPITHISIDPVLLVRILGIFLDNATEELISLGHGELLVGLIKNSDHIMIIVQNTCRNDIPNIQTLQRQNFSTKHSGRGLGLGNVIEIIGQCPNVISETAIKNNVFLQKLIIYDQRGE